VSTAPEGAPLHLRMKIWTDPKTQKRYLAAQATEDKKTGLFTAWVQADMEAPRKVVLTGAQWSALPLSYFKEEGAAEHALNLYPPQPQAAQRPGVKR
jgi:hypothetical protein